MGTPSYWAVIPADVRYSDLKPSAKLLYGEITCLQNQYGYCWATNRYFSELYGVTKNTVSSWVSQLEKKGFITVELERNEKKQIVKRKIGITNKNVTPITKNSEVNITSLNNTSNNKKTISERKLEFERQVFKVTDVSVEVLKEFCDYWCEQNISKTKMNFELQKTFDINLRLKRWCKNNEKWNTKQTQNFNKNSKVKHNLNTWKNARNLLNNIET